jgi:hypothetical protein
MAVRSWGENETGGSSSVPASRTTTRAIIVLGVRREIARSFKCLLKKFCHSFDCKFVMPKNNRKMQGFLR